MVPSICNPMVAPTNNSTCAISSCFGVKSSGSLMFWLIFLVECMPFLVQFMCPFMVAVDFRKYFHTSADVIAENLSWLLLIALQRVSKVWGKRHWCGNVIVSANDVD
jgi:hypothetical protein